MKRQAVGSHASDGNGGARALAERAAARAAEEMRDFVQDIIEDELRNAAFASAGVAQLPGCTVDRGAAGNPVSQESNQTVRCIVERFGKHYRIHTSGGEMAVLDACRGTWRLLLLLANVGTEVALANVFHVDRKKSPYIIVGKGGLCGTGLDKDGTVSLTYKPIIEDSHYIQKLKRDLKENLEEQDAPHASSNEARLGELQAREDEIKALLKPYYDAIREAERIRRTPESQQKGSVEHDIHAAYMSVHRAIAEIKATAPCLGEHLKPNVKVNGHIRYQKTVGWEWEFAFGLERVNLLAGDYRDSEHDQK